MAKPIFVIQIPAAAEKNKVIEIQERLDKKLFDWHVLIISNLAESEITFTSFKDDEAQDIDIEVLKEMIIKQLKQ